MPSAAATDAQSVQARTLVDRFRRALRTPEFPARLAHRGRWLSARCLIEIQSEALIIHIEAGVPHVVENPLPLAPWDFAIRGPASAWSALWEQTPPPGRHDLFALAKRGEMRVEGNLHPLLANLQYIKDLLALPRYGARP